MKPHGCKGKRRFTNYQTLHRLRTRKERAGLRLRIYLCRVCGGWHLTRWRFDDEIRKMGDPRQHLLG